MNQFPTLKTGAVTQYPAEQAIIRPTFIVRFLDGSEQRYRLQASPQHRWTLQLSLLDEGELHQLREFFRAQHGQLTSFEFTDPGDGTVYSSCSLESDAMGDVLTDVFDSGTQLTIRENRS